MIKRHDAEQCFECDLCGELLEFTRGHARDPEVLLQMEDEFKREHRPCAEFKDDPARARAERQFQDGMRRELGKAERQDKSPRRRCNGAPRIGTGNRGRTCFRGETK